MTNLNRGLLVRLLFFFAVISGPVLGGNLPADYLQLGIIVKAVEANPLVASALKQATDAGESCKAPVILATKPPQFENNTVFEYTETILCVPHGERKARRRITVT